MPKGRPIHVKDVPWHRSTVVAPTVSPPKGDPQASSGFDYYCPECGNPQGKLHTKACSVYRTALARQEER